MIIGSFVSKDAVLSKIHLKIKVMEVMEIHGYTLERCNSNNIWDIYLKVCYTIFKDITYLNRNLFMFFISHQMCTLKKIIWNLSSNELLLYI